MPQKVSALWIDVRGLRGGFSGNESSDFVARGAFAAFGDAASPSTNVFASPKSAKTTYPSSPRSTFSGLRSR